ncbi:MAG TPA: patatin-like phospholipase family protein [Steroidobacteraceae bacterium]|jgi:hypothetical protein
MRIHLDNGTAKHSALTKAVCLDLPYILDSIWRHAEFDANSQFAYVLADDGSSVRVAFRKKPFTSSPAFWLYLIAATFVAYGPTLDSLCSIIGASGMRYARISLGACVAAAALLLGWRLSRYGAARADKRFRKARINDDERWRRVFVHAGVQLGVLVIVAGLGFFASYFFTHASASFCRAPPSVVPAWIQLAVVLLLAAVHRAASIRIVNRASRTYAQAAALIAMGLFLWCCVARSDASEANQTPYLHIYGVFACLLVAVASLAPRIARWQVGSISPETRKLYRDSLSEVELFPGSRTDPAMSTRRIVAALSTGVCYHPLHFLLLPSIFSLMVPSLYLPATFLGGCLVSAWLLMTGSFSSRWQAMVEKVRGAFFDGTPLLVSISVIGLAVLRLARVQYVATVLDAATFGVIFTWVVMAYALLWWFEYSINGSVAVELLGVLDDQNRDRPEEVRYPANTIPESLRTVEVSHRFIAAHGAGRFVLLGWFRDKDTQQPTAAFETYDLMELFSRLTPAGLDDFWHDLKRRIQLSFLTLNFLVALILGLGFYYSGYGDRTNTVSSVVSAKPAERTANLTDLANQLKTHKTPVFIVAASGGGTRAALFTATALEGLYKLGVARDVILLSGVSGGGVAAAYFFSHRDALTAGGKPATAEWQRFKDRMADNFIEDVLEGAGEWRMMSREPLGNLLVESFQRRLFDTPRGQATLAGDSDIALILNTTIAAHPKEDSDLLRGEFAASQPNQPCVRLHRPYSLMAGGRLIFTNLQGKTAFPQSGATAPTATSGLSIPDVRLPYVVVNDPTVQIAAAAALNANFPPVFANARVDVPSEIPDANCQTRTYYVTDGGAQENLGLVSALYALRGSLQELSPSEIPEIHIVTIEASATGYDYAPDRGLGAAVGAKDRITGGLTQELLNEIGDLAVKRTQDPLRIQIHDLALPLAFRSRGGFGTHWMFPESIVIANPRVAAPAEWYSHLVPSAWLNEPLSAVLNKGSLTHLWTALHDPGGDFCTKSWNPQERRVAGWVCGGNAEDPAPDIHITEWRRLVEAVQRAKTLSRNRVP